MGEFRKKKKKRSFLQTAKRYGKQGIYGKGKRLEEDEYHYYIRIFEQLKAVDKEAKVVLVDNFFEEITKDGKVKILVTNQVVSRILDEVLPFAPIEKLIFIMKIFSEDLRLFSIDSFASHVLQSLLTIGFKHIQKSGNSDDDSEVKVTEEQRAEIESFLVMTSRFIYNNLGDFINETYASHVIRTVLEICSGIEIKASIRSSQRSHLHHAVRNDPSQLLEVPPQLKELLQQFIVRFSKLPNFPALICSECSSAVLQSAILVSIALSNEEKESQKLARHIVKRGFKELDPNSESRPEALHLLFAHNAAIRLLEVVVFSVSSKWQKVIFHSYFEGKISLIIQHRLANFALQKLVISWKDRETFDLIYDGVCNFLEEALNATYTGIIHSLVQACRKLQTHQAQIMQQVFSLLDCWEPESNQEKIAPLLLFLTRLKDFEEKNPFEEEYPLSLHGSLILQEFLQFNKPIKVVKSILGMNLTCLQKMACNQCGSHVVDAFVNSALVGEKSREKLISAFQGAVANLACHKHGSRSLEALWSKAGVRQKTNICLELQQAEKKLKDTPHGTIIYNKFQVRLFKRNDKSDWEELQKKEHARLKKLQQFFVTDDSENVAAPILSKELKKSSKRKKEDEEEKIDNSLTITGDDIPVKKKKRKKDKQKCNSET